MEIKELENKDIWEDFVTAQREYSFLHSWAWGEFNKSIGDKIWRFGIYAERELIAVLLVIKVHARRGNFLFVPHGPIFAESKEITKKQETITKILGVLTKKLKRIAKEEKVNFIRISPLFKNNKENIKIFKRFGYRPAPIYVHAETTWMLLLNKSEDDLLYGMRKNTRNLIRRAARDGVEIESLTDYAAIDEFRKLYKETSKKHSFVPFSAHYIESEMKAFNQEENCNARVYLAKYKNKYISGAIVVFYGNSAFYHHGASSSRFPKIPASYLLQWKIIQDVKNQGKKFYNFWGIAKDEENKKHPWYGLTLFKKGFGGERTDYMHAQDLVLNYKYWINYVVEKIRLWRRGV